VVYVAVFHGRVMIPIVGGDGEVSDVAAFGFGSG